MYNPGVLWHRCRGQGPISCSAWTIQASYSSDEYAAIKWVTAELSSASYYSLSMHVTALCVYGRSMSNYIEYKKQVRNLMIYEQEKGTVFSTDEIGSANDRSKKGLFHGWERIWRKYLSRTIHSVCNCIRYHFNAHLRGVHRIPDVFLVVHFDWLFDNGYRQLTWRFCYANVTAYTANETSYAFPEVVSPLTIILSTLDSEGQRSWSDHRCLS